MPFDKFVKESITKANNGYCIYPKCLNKVESVHHKLHDIEYNRKRFPLFLDSPFNAAPLCSKHHTHYQHEFRVTEAQAEVYEEWLRERIKSES